MCTVSKLSEIYTHHNDSKKVRESNFFASWFHEIFFLWMSGEKRTEDCDESSDSQCGNFGNFPTLQKFFVKLIYSITLL